MAPPQSPQPAHQGELSPPTSPHLPPAHPPFRPICPCPRFAVLCCSCCAQVVIQKGEVLAGTLCKKSLGAAAGGLVHIIWMEFGPEAARAFLSQVQYTINHWLLQHGFSIGG